MSQSTPLDIKVVYSASKRGRRPAPGPVAPNQPPQQPGRKPKPMQKGGGSAKPVGLALVNLLLAGALCYFSWWHVDRYIFYDVVLLQTPVFNIDMDAAAEEIFGIKPDPVSARGAATQTSVPPLLPPAKPVKRSRYDDKTTQIIIVATGFGWLTLASISMCALALAAGTGLGASWGMGLRRAALMFAVLAVLLLVGAWVAVFTKYEGRYTPLFLRCWMGGLCLLFALWGLASGRNGGRRFRRASFAMLLSAAGSVGGLYLWSQCAVRVDLEAIGVVGAAFVAAQWVYGAILWPTARRFA